MTQDPADTIPVPLERRWIRGAGIELHLQVAGPTGGDLVLLLHGFPEFWYGWRHQIPALVDAGYRVAIPDQRGYNRSEAPRSVRAYDLDRLAADARSIIEAAGEERAHVVGHDWGAIVAWHLAMTAPERVRTLGILNGPHPGVFWRMVTQNIRQMWRSLYVLLFQIPYLPEWLLGYREGTGLATLLRLSRHPDAAQPVELSRYRRAWTRPGRLRGMLHWYRAGMRRAVRGGIQDETVRVPTLVLWGKRDAALSPQLAARSAAQCLESRTRIFDTASHWLQHDEPDAVNALLRQHF